MGLAVNAAYQAYNSQITVNDHEVILVAEITTAALSCRTIFSNLASLTKKSVSCGA